MVNLFILNVDLKENARLLNDRHLGKSRLETKQIINVLEGKSEGYKNHTAVLSWKDYIPALKIYYNFIIREWISRGFKNNMELYDINEKYYIITSYFDGIKTVFYEEKQEDDVTVFPWWVGWWPFIQSHRAAVLRKKPDYYSHFYNEDLIPYLKYGYVWPNRLKNDILTNFTMEAFDGLGTGCPPIFTIPREELLKWNENRFVNPKTNRKITEKGTIYIFYLKGYNELIDLNNKSDIYKMIYQIIWNIKI